MPQGPFSRIVIRRPNGAVEIIGRNGHIDPSAASKMMAERQAGTVLVVRHEQSPPQAGTVLPPIAVHHLAK